MKDEKSVLNGVQAVVFDVDGTLYDKRGLARKMVRHLWWSLPLLLSERLARRKMHFVQYPSGEEFFAAFFPLLLSIRSASGGKIFGSALWLRRF